MGLRWLGTGIITLTLAEVIHRIGKEAMGRADRCSPHDAQTRNHRRVTHAR